MYRYIFVVCMVLLASPAFADGWELYDDFNTGTLNASLWDTVGNVTVENNKLKLEHTIDQQVDYTHRTRAMLKTDGTVYGIRCKVTLQSMSSYDVANYPYFRISKTFGTYTGPLDYDQMWGMVALFPHPAVEKYRFYSSFSLDNSIDGSYLDRGSAENRYQGAIIGRELTLEAMQYTNGMHGKIDNDLQQVYYYDSVSNLTYPFALNIRPRNVGDTFVIYIDDVEIYRGAPGALGTGSGSGGAIVIPMF